MYVGMKLHMYMPACQPTYLRIYIHTYKHIHIAGLVSIHFQIRYMFSQSNMFTYSQLIDTIWKKMQFHMSQNIIHGENRYYIKLSLFMIHTYKQEAWRPT